MCLITDDEIPVGDAQFFLNRFIPCELVEADDAEVRLRKHVARHSRLDAIVRQDLEMQVEFAIELVLPLFGEAARRDDHAAFQVTTDEQFLEKQSCHDGLARAGVVREDVAERQARQHLLIDGRDLMRQWLDGRGMHGKIGVKEVSDVDAVCLRGKAHIIRIRIKRPRQMRSTHRKPCLILPIEDLTGELSAIILHCDLKPHIAEPAHGDDGHGRITHDPCDPRTYGKIFQSRHRIASFPSCPTLRYYNTMMRMLGGCAPLLRMCRPTAQ